MVQGISKLIGASKSILTGMGLTIRRVRMPEVTRRYPHESFTPNERFRGTPELLNSVDYNDVEVSSSGDGLNLLNTDRSFANPVEIDHSAFNTGIEEKLENGILPQCTYACPAHVDIRGYVGKIAEGRMPEALEIIRDRCSLPASIGRVCTRPCETGCKRGTFDEAISIRDLKRFAADECMDLPHPARIKPQSDKKVAIIGAGPAGLTAAHRLITLGYKVTVFDKNPKGGGTLLTGIPKYRLPKDILKWDVDAICSLGVELKTNVTIGKDIKLNDLIAGYDAVLIATGLPDAWTLGIEGEDADGVWNCLDLLREMNFDRSPKIGRKVAVVGGGNVAMDGARTALRLGAKEVYLIYRRSMEEMPARHEEIHEAVEEGVIFTLLTNPKKVIVENGKVKGLECIKMGLGEPDASGRRRPEPIEGSEFVLDLDSVVVAIGQQADLSFLEGVEVGRTQRGAIEYDRLTMQTSNPRLFVAGEVVTGAGAAIEAIAGGHEAAESLRRFLCGENLEAGRTPQVMPHVFHEAPEIPAEWIEEKRLRAKMPMISLDERLNGFKEVELGFPKDRAIAEAQRCLVCETGHCSGCTMCARACPAFCISVEKKYSGAGGNGDNGDKKSRSNKNKTVIHSLDLTKCMFCGLCAEACPTGSLIMSNDFENSEVEKEKLLFVRNTHRP